MRPILSVKFMLTLLTSLLFQIGQPNLSQSYAQTTQEKVKKIVMMLNIAAKEFQDGVVEGKWSYPGNMKSARYF